MSAPTLRLSLRLAARTTLSAATGMALVILMVGALFPAVGGSIGKLDLPEGVSDLLGGADYGTLIGWMRSEIGAIYGPLVIAAVAIATASGSTAGEEEAGILSLVLAHPVRRSRLLLEKAAASALAVAGGGVGLGDQLALCIHLAFFGFFAGALALLLAAATGRRAVAVMGAAGFVILGFLINGFAPLVDGISWLRYFSPFYWYEEGDPLVNGIDVADLAVLGLAAVTLTAAAVFAFRRRDLRG